MIGLRVEIRRYVDDHQPGWVECAFSDAHGLEWLFVEKVPIVTAENLDAASRYPRPGVIACQVVSRQTGAAESEVLLVDTEQPWQVGATTGETRFEVRPQQLETFDWNGAPGTLQAEDQTWPT